MISIMIITMIIIIICHLKPLKMWRRVRFNSIFQIDMRSSSCSTEELRFPNLMIVNYSDRELFCLGIMIIINLRDHGLDHMIDKKEAND